ncbi:MAG: AprI/Inh family metalloprotease inhibitor [Methylocystis sp.]|nr:AprI/Inh family metalloprotease inhibitor [Methylocystis sp.]MCA3582509.1 AprI/Inh family metalloprotease inhibitor [Methylocystis sp.]MCA3588793.1 AprI/Inh family metalloprotease inhibitor [Methylocystis sp.]MCA3592867.1 AprI/Inh family metalloprotease inhibitor [Methylocystis sp.]
MTTGIADKLAFASVLALALAGCDSSSRFSNFGGRQTVLPDPPPPRAQTFTPAPTERVDSSPLPPPGGGPAPGALPGPTGGGTASPGLPPIGSSVPIEPDPPKPEPRPAPPTAAGAPTRTGVTGNWTAREATGGTCRITLSSIPTLDLYKASSSGCQSRELQRVSAWELRGEEVYLYEPGGGVAARLRQSGRDFEGTAAKTGAPVTLTK